MLRGLSADLTVGSALSASMAIAFRSGNKGMNIHTSNTNFSNSTRVYNFNVGNNQYQYDIGAGLQNLGWTYSQTSIFDIVAKQTSTTNLEVTVTRRGTSDTDTRNVTGRLRGIKFYTADTEAGNNLNNLFFNSLKIYTY